MNVIIKQIKLSKSSKHAFMIVKIGRPKFTDPTIFSNLLVVPVVIKCKVWFSVLCIVFFIYLFFYTANFDAENMFCTCNCHLLDIKQTYIFETKIFVQYVIFLLTVSCLCGLRTK